MNLHYKQFFLVLALLALAACQRPEAPDFEGVENFRVDVKGLTKAQVNGDAVFFNPNRKKIKIRQIDLSVFVEGEKVKDISREFDIVALPDSEFIIPIDVTLSLSDLNQNLLNTAMSMLKGAKKKVRYEGQARVTVNGLPLRVPFTYEEDVRLNL
jgi:LEA14-like dessication related protein